MLTLWTVSLLEQEGYVAVLCKHRLFRVENWHSGDIEGRSGVIVWAVDFILIDLALLQARST